jgi:glutamate-1-semialdehyde 2,1-aminomutase
MRLYREEGIVDRLYDRGDRLRVALQAALVGQGLERHILLLGRSPNIVFATLDANGQRSQSFRTLFLQEMIGRGVIAPSFVVSAAISDEDIDRTSEAVAGALGVYRRALDDGVERYLRGRPVKPVFRPYA